MRNNVEGEGREGQEYRIHQKLLPQRGQKERLKESALNRNNEKRRQEVSHVLATFPMVNTYRTDITLDNHGANIGDVEVSQSLNSGTVIFRRAEDKVVERYEIKNSSFFQNLILRLYIQVRMFDTTQLKYTTLRRPMLLGRGDVWSAKLRFRTL